MDMRMRNRLSLIALLASTAASHALTFQGVEYSGFSSFSDTSAIDNRNAHASDIIAALSDDSYTTGIANLGSAEGAAYNGAGTGGSLEGTFGKALVGGAQNSSSYVCFLGGGVTGYSWGSFSMKLRLADGSYTSAVTFNQNTMSSTGVTIPGTGIYYSSSLYGVTVPSNTVLNKASILISDFGTINQEIVGAKIYDLSSQWPDVTFIGITGTFASGGGVVPEASTYGIALGGLALAGALIRRRRSSK